jgi:N-acetylneuraminate synthase
VLTVENLRCVRPGFGLPPKHLDSLLGQRIERDAVAGTPMAWALLSPTA